MRSKGQCAQWDDLDIGDLVRVSLNSGDAVTGVYLGLERNNAFWFARLRSPYDVHVNVRTLTVRRIRILRKRTCLQ